jgi:PAS domain-containing protein
MPSVREHDSTLSAAALAAAPDAVLTCDPAGRVVAVNDAAADLLDAAPDSEIGDLLGDVTDGGLAALADRRTRATIHGAGGAPIECEVAVAKLDGLPFFAVWVRETAATSSARRERPTR